jgi:hypothetical protein
MTTTSNRCLTARSASPWSMGRLSIRPEAPELGPLVSQQPTQPIHAQCGFATLYRAYCLCPCCLDLTARVGPVRIRREKDTRRRPRPT